MQYEIEKKITYNVPMKEHTSFKIGGTADYFLKITNEEELKQALIYAKEKNIPITIIGNGSNILVLDKGIRGLVVKIDIQKEEKKEQENNIEVTVGSGVKLMKLAIDFLNSEISGFEELAGIPGTIGGAIYMNAGAYGKEIKDLVLSTKCMDYNGNVYTFSNEQQGFGYRSSIFNKNEYIILETTLKLTKGNKAEIKNKMDEFNTKRKNTQPTEYPSAGSSFKRQEGVITAKLIDECGLKGYKIGGAMVSTKHAGFIVNTGDATAKDVLELVKYIKEKVYEKFNVRIEEEIRILGDS